MDKPAVPVPKLHYFENELGVQAPVGFWDPAGSPAPLIHFDAYMPEVRYQSGEVRRCTQWSLVTCLVVQF